MEKITLKSPKRSFNQPHASRWMVTVSGAIVVLLVAFSIYGILNDSRQQRIDSSLYQAVYLTNGQMYFGKLQNTSGDYLTLKSAYMPQSTNAELQADTSALIRVRNQLWGPEDSMAIRSSQVAFWQNLRDDSKVTQAIKAKSE